MSSFNNLVVTKRSDVPEYLHHGDFYKSLNDEDDEQISVPANALKLNLIVENNDDLEYLLSSLRFWAVDKVLEEVVVYCINKNPTSCSSVLEHFRNDFRYVDKILQMILLTDEDRAKLAIESGILELVTILYESCSALPDGCHIAARAGHLNILQYLHQHGGQLDNPVEIFSSGVDTSLCANTCAHAAVGGNMDCLQYIQEQGCPIDSSTLSAAIYAGQTACVEYALLHDNLVTDTSFCTVAARKGHLQALKLLHAAGAPWNVHTCSEAAYNGHLDCVQYLHENGCPWRERVCRAAAEMGHLDCLIYAHEKGCPWDHDTCYFAARMGHLHCLKYAHENGCVLYGGICNVAAEKGHLECLKYAHESGCPWDEITLVHATIGGQLECLKYAHQYGCGWDPSVTLNAARRGHLSCLQYALEQGCEVTEDAYREAIEFGHSDCVVYLQAHRPNVCGANSL